MAPSRSYSLAFVVALGGITGLTASRGVAPAAERWQGAAFAGCGLLLCAWCLLSRNPRLGPTLACLFGLAALLSPGLPENERAGMLAVSLPLWWAAFSGFRAKRQANDSLPAPATEVSGLTVSGLTVSGLTVSGLAVSGLVILGMAAVLVVGGSRGGLGAAILGAALTLVGGASRPSRLAWGLLFGGAGLTIALWHVELEGEALWQRVSLEQSAHGWSIDHALSGRPAIWWRSAWAIEDTPLTGLGPGGFEHALKGAYPGGPRVDDAHQLLLQTAHDWGLPGALLFVVLAGQALAGLALRWRQSETHGERREISAVAGGLLAFFAFGIADALSLSHAGGLLLWPLLGAGLRGACCRLWQRRLLYSAATLAVALSLMNPDSEQAARQAIATLGAPPASDSAVTDQLETYKMLRTKADEKPSLGWLTGLSADRQGMSEARDDAWRRLIDSSAERLELLAAAQPNHQLSLFATQRWPEHAEAWRWRAWTHHLQEDAAAEIKAWRRTVTLEPSDGRSWLRLGDLLAESDPATALEAYAKACIHGDPGANACGRGGLLAERHGASIRAAALYRRSRWPPIRSRAERLQ